MGTATTIGLIALGVVAIALVMSGVTKLTLRLMNRPLEARIAAAGSAKQLEDQLIAVGLRVSQAPSASATQPPVATAGAAAAAAAAAKPTVEYFNHNHRPVIALSKGVIFVPFKETFPLVDAFMFAPPPSSPAAAATLVAFQMTTADSPKSKHRPKQPSFTSFVEAFNAVTFIHGDAAQGTIANDFTDKPIDASRLKVQIGRRTVPLDMSVVYITRANKFGYQSMDRVKGAWTSAHFAWDQVKQFRVDTMGKT
jgi:hypothetical protein